MSVIVNSDISRHIYVIFSQIVVYLEHCVTLAYSEPCHIQNSGIFRTQDIFRTLSRHVQAYSIMIVIITLTFFLSQWSYIVFNKIWFYMFFGYNAVNFYARLKIIRDLWKYGYNRITKTHVFFNKQIYDRKKSFLTKYCRIRSNLTMFRNFLTFSFEANK